MSFPKVLDTRIHLSLILFGVHESSFCSDVHLQKHFDFIMVHKFWFVLISVWLIGGGCVGPTVIPNSATPPIDIFDITINIVRDWAIADKNPGGQDIDGFEVWPGVFAIGRAGLETNLMFLSFDVEDMPGNDFFDLLTKTGVSNMFQILRRVKIDGLVWLAPQCSSFVFANSSRHKRCQFNTGDTTYPLC